MVTLVLDIHQGDEEEKRLSQSACQSLTWQNWKTR